MRRTDGALEIVYHVSGAAGLKAAPRGMPARRDGLWRTTCFEAFIKPGAADAYFEFNFSPSSEWAAYRFYGYRQGMTDADVPAPSIGIAVSGRIFELSATIDLRPLGVTPSARIGLSAVLEAETGEKTYWALRHGGDKPDFHRADGFIARLPFDRAP